VVLEGVFYQADLWLDGAYLGDAEGYFFPHSYDITALSRLGDDHVLAVEVDCRPPSDLTAKRAVTGVFQHWDCLDPDDNPGGVWRPVHIESTGPVRVDRLRVLCRDASPDNAHVRLHARFDSDTSRPVTIVTRVEGHIVADYAVTLGDMGTLTLSNTMSIVDKWDQQELASAPVEDCKGVWGGVCGFPNPDFRNNLRVTWLTPWDVTASVLWRHMGEVEDLNGNLDLPSYNYLDVAGVWDVLENTSLRAGINNVLDKEPPIAGNAAGPSIGGNGNTFPGVYDALGRYMYVGVTVSF
jgi:hypothetical protein